MKLLNYLLCLIITFVVMETHAQANFKSYNLAHQYNPESEVDLSCMPFEQNDSLRMHLAFGINQPRAAFNHYSFNFFTVNSFNNKLQPIPREFIDSTYTGVSDKKHMLFFSTPSARMLPIIIIEVHSKFSGFNYYFDFPASQYPLTLVDESGSLYFKPWISPGPFKFNRRKGLTGYYYDHDFPPALPPMPIKKDTPEKSMEVDSVFSLNGEEAFFTNPGLYLIQIDTADNKGLGFRVEGKYYPRLVKLEELVEPLIYITTNEENKILQGVEGNKKEFDRFWLDLTGSQERARNIIKYYFQRVEEANQLFTTYKEGWKTDMGMIYIIFGPPDEVNKSVKAVSWHYQAVPNAPALRFDFLKTETIFATSYVLVRDKKYTSAWYRAVDQWRKGRLE